MLQTPDKIRELQRKLYRKAKVMSESLWKKMTCLRVAASAKAGRKALPTGRQAYSGAKLDRRETN